MYILVAHPGRQHSHQVALALQARGLLAGYWTGVPCLLEHKGWIPHSLWRRHVHYTDVPLQRELVKWFPMVPVLIKVGNQFANQKIAKQFEYLSYALFDRWAAHSLRNKRNEIDVVIAYENSAVRTFKSTKAAGSCAVLDAASLHYETHRYSGRVYAKANVESPSITR